MTASDARTTATGPAPRAASPNTTFRARARDFFAPDDAFVRLPAPGAGRRDAFLTVVVVTASALGLELARSADVLAAHPVWAEYAGIAVMAAPLLVRRRMPVLVAITSSLAFFVVGLTMPDVAAQLSVQMIYFFALFSSMAWARDRRLMLATMGGVLLLMFGWLAVQFSVGSAIDSLEAAAGKAGSTGLFGHVAASVVYLLLVNALYFGGAVLGGQAAWRAARQRDRLATQAHTLQTQAGRLRQHVVVQERLRIARELHDVVAHHVSVMGVQAAAARRVLARDPSAAASALGSVESSAREAVTEMRALLGTLRQGDSESSRSGMAGAGADTEGGTAHRSPAPGVTAIPGLVAQLTDPTFTVRYTVVESEPGALSQVSPAVGLTLYRTVQEAVSNVRRHSSATTVGVVLRVDSRGGQPEAGGAGGAPGGFAEVEVLDDGRPRMGSSGSGLGLLGMRERVASLDGVLDIGPRVTGGFRVRIRLPLVGPAFEQDPVGAGDPVGSLAPGPAGVHRVRETGRG